MAKKRILLVEDDQNLGFITEDNLTLAGFKVDWQKGGLDALDAFCANVYDLVILDVMLPQKDGFELLQDIRKINLSIPVLMLTAKSLDEDKIKGFKYGVDDYLTKPFNMEELILRIQSLLKRGGMVLEDQKQFLIHNIQFLPNDQLLKGPNNFEQKLTKKETAILKLLCTHKGETIKRDYALKLIWGESDYFKGRSMDVFIAKIRKYFEHEEAITIQNIHGVGFKMDW